MTSCLFYLQAHILNGGAVEMLGAFARDSTDPASARMIAGAVANLCGNGEFILTLV